MAFIGHDDHTRCQPAFADVDQITLILAVSPAKMVRQTSDFGVGGAALSGQVDPPPAAMKGAASVAQPRAAYALAAVELAAMLTLGAIVQTEVAATDTASRFASCANCVCT